MTDGRRENVTEGARMTVRAGENVLEGGRLRPIGVIRSTLKTLLDAPRQGPEGAPDAWLEVHAWAVEGLRGLAAGDEIIVITWLHQADRDVLKVHPRSDVRNPLTGVFATRSEDRPNPLGLHPVTVRAIEGSRLRIGPIEAIDGTPVVDIKPVLGPPKRKRSTAAGERSADTAAAPSSPPGTASSRPRRRRNPR